MADDVVISLQQVSKVFRRYPRPVDRLKEILLPGKPRSEAFWAVQNVSLQIRQGQTVGIIGRNGSGKSTLLQIIAGTLQPTSGEVRVRGRVSALLELGSGFNPEFTGRQNVFFNGRILGLSQEEIAAKFEDIAAFAEIGDFMDQPVKTYSSGMFVRLAFAVAVHVDPEVLIVDEALAVGDGIFVHRCMTRIQEFQDAGGTILFVSHDMGAVTRLCSEVVWMNGGQVAEVGKPADISRTYQAWVYEQINARHRAEAEEELAAPEPLPVETPKQRVNPFVNRPYRAFPSAERFGTGRAEVTVFRVLNELGEETSFLEPGEWITVDMEVLAHDPVQSPLVGVSLFDRLRVAIAGFNTFQYRHELPPLAAGDFLHLQVHIRWPEIQGGSYVLEPAVASGSQDNHEMLDWLQLLMSVESSASDLTFGMMKFPGIKITHQVTAAKKGV